MRQLCILISTLLIVGLNACQSPAKKLDHVFDSPPEQAKPWVFWYWMHAAVSPEGITADLEAMREAGIGGAYLMPIYGEKDPLLYHPSAQQLTPRFWEMVTHAMKEANRLGLKIAMHASDGFALAGGPWITPELSMQKVVWTHTLIEGGTLLDDTIPTPESVHGYYRDIATFAIPIPKHISCESSFEIKPRVTCNRKDEDVSFLNNRYSKDTFKSDDSCWVQFEFNKPFTCRNIEIITSGNSYQAHKLIVETSNDGKNFSFHTRLIPPRHGWQNNDACVTHAIKPVTAKYFRFVHTLEGTEPGAEDLDAAKWSPRLKVNAIGLSSLPLINQFEGKSGAVWRISHSTSTDQLPDPDCIQRDSIIQLTDFMSAKGHLRWNVPKGKWLILRMGHTSTGHTNYTGGGGLGLECDKFNRAAVQLQFDSWFGEIIKQVDSDDAPNVLKVFHVDSWECGSQNWSPVFRNEFMKRRGYDLLPYLPVMAGIPVQNRETSEKVLYDIRLTITDLVHEVFYGEFRKKCDQNGVLFSAESIAPTMTSDGLQHYHTVDIPMGEFWHNSPTHDKPNDMLDAVSGAHIYGKPIVQAEAFTTVRMNWSEHPGMLKALGDRNFALGINRMVFHVFTQNPWTDKKPGMTLDGVGLYFQRDQTWWKPGREWITYLQRCQALLQEGDHVADLAVFTGEEIPRRSVLPDRLIPTLPGIFGDDRVQQEMVRLKNEGQPLREVPDGVRNSANMADPEKWVNPLNGYAYDSFNPDAFIRLARVENGSVRFGGNNPYRILVFPGACKMNPEGNYMSAEVAEKMLQLIKEGATVLIAFKPECLCGLNQSDGQSLRVKKVTDEIWGGTFNTFTTPNGKYKSRNIGKGKVIMGPYHASDFSPLGLEADFKAFNEDGRFAKQLAYCHRKGPDFDMYFVSNQQDSARRVEVSLRITGKTPEIFHPVTGEREVSKQWKMTKNRTNVILNLAQNESVFLIFRQTTTQTESEYTEPQRKVIADLSNQWTLSFDTASGGPSHTFVIDTLIDWSTSVHEGVRYYSGTASYMKHFTTNLVSGTSQRYYLRMDPPNNLAEVILNGQSCGVIWTAPFELNITEALRDGDNNLEIKVTNTWANRLMGDHLSPEKKPLTFTTAPFRLSGKPLLKAGMTGKVIIESSEK